MNSLSHFKVRKDWPACAYALPDEIVPHVYVSGVGFTTDLPAWCRQNNITHILNVSGSYGRKSYYRTHPHDHGIKYLELDIEDNDTFNINPAVSIACDFITHALQENGNVLIHCIWGQSRSVSCLIAYLMVSRNITYESALQLIQSKRILALPNPGFAKQLRTYYV